MTLIRTLPSCRKGTIAVITAMTLPVLLGMGSLGIEVGHWYLAMRVMQGAADAAAISAGAEYVKQYNLRNPTSTIYKVVGQSYAALNGFTIPLVNTCLVDSNGIDGCGAIEALDARPVVCHTPPCVVVEVTQNTFQWLTTRTSLQPNGPGRVQGIPTPVLLARAVVSVKSQLDTTTASDCILALANDPQAILVHGGGDPQAKCGIAIDGGLDQNTATPVVGGITFQGNGSKINVNKLTIAAPTANCPDNGTHCQQYGSTNPLLASQVSLGTATPDPYAPQINALFSNPPPQGVSAVAISASGSGYPHNATCRFTVTGGTFYGGTSSPAVFSATTDNRGKVTGIGAISDPGAYATPGFPTGAVSASSNCAGSGANFTLTEGCWTFTGTVPAIAGRKYCSINLKGNSGTFNFPTGSYWIAGGDSCQGFCVSSQNTTVTSDPAGVTFFLTNGEGANVNNYASVGITSGTIKLCAPGTNCGTSCTNAAGPTSCMLFIQNPATLTKADSISNGNPPNTDNTFSGNGVETLSGLVYLPGQTFTVAGGTTIQGCVGAIAKYFDIGGTPTFSDGCLPGNGIGSTTVTTTLSLPHLSQ